MAISVTCECGKTLFGPDRSAGKQGRCPGCGKILRMPGNTPGERRTGKIGASASAKPHNTAIADDEDLSLDLDAPAQPEPRSAPRRNHDDDHHDSPAIPRKPKKKETDRERHGIVLGSFMGIELTPPNIAGIVVFIAILASAVIWWRGLTSDFTILSAESVDSVVVFPSVEFKSTSQFKLGGRKPNPDFIADPPEGEILPVGSDVVAVTHPDPAGGFVLVRAEISQQIMHEEKMESGYDMAFRAGSFKVVGAAESVDAFLIISPVQSGFEMDSGALRTANPMAYLPPGAVPDKKEEKKDDHGRLASGVYTFDGKSGYTGTFRFLCFYIHDEVFGDRQGLSAQGVLKYKSPGGTSIKYDYDNGMGVSWSLGCDGWVSKASYIREDGNSMYAKFPVMLLFPKPKGGGPATITFCGRKVAKINLESIAESTAPRVIGKNGSVAQNPKPGDAPSPAAPAKPQEKHTEKPADKGEEGISDPLTGYLGAVAKARNKALGIISDVNMGELAKTIFTCVETNNGKWPENLDEVEKTCPGTKALAAKAPRRGSDGYIYVKPSQNMGQMTAPDTVPIIFESKDGKIDRSGNCCFADGHVGPAPPP